MYFWQLDGNGNPVASFDLPEKTCAVDLDYPYVFIGSITDKFTVLRIDTPNNIKIGKYT
jgi:hypothetical protein